MTLRSEWTRRTFLKVSFTAGGGLVVGAYLGGCTTDPPAPEPTAIPSPTEAPTATATDWHRRHPPVD